MGDGKRKLKITELIIFFKISMETSKDITTSNSERTVENNRK
jgi:hypothetical protein